MLSNMTADERSQNTLHCALARTITGASPGRVVPKYTPGRINTDSSDLRPAATAACANSSSTTRMVQSVVMSTKPRPSQKDIPALSPWRLVQKNQVLCSR